MIIEGLCTTVNLDGSVNIAPMGPVVNEELTQFLFRPFQTSTTFANLKRTGCGVFHVTDDAALMARAAVGDLEEIPPLQRAEKIDGYVLTDACRWLEFEVSSIDDSQPRTEIHTRIVHRGHLRDFWGFNRARHALLETAILATRVHILPRQEILQQLAQNAVIMQKTASERDLAAFAFLHAHLTRQLNETTHT